MGDNPDPFIPSGAVAVIIAPGPVLRRQGGVEQSRGCTVGVNCDTSDVCTQSTLTGTPKCRAANFLDRTASEDNQQFIDGHDSNGFIQGVVFDAAGNVIVNDRVLPITYSDIMPLLERRAIKEVLICLQEYKVNNIGRYPWAAKLNPAGPPDYDDVNGERFGRLPDILVNTKVAIGAAAWDNWPNAPDSNCKLTSDVSTNTWWLNWKEIVFYGVAAGFQPDPTAPSCGPPPNNCLTINPPSLAQDKEVVVIASGKRLRDVAGGQPRTNNVFKADVRNYMESDNATPLLLEVPDDTFTMQPPSDIFNDTVCTPGAC
jgi:hypothetical protein